MILQAISISVSCEVMYTAPVCNKRHLYVNMKNSIFRKCAIWPKVCEHLSITPICSYSRTMNTSWFPLCCCNCLHKSGKVLEHGCGDFSKGVKLGVPSHIKSVGLKLELRSRKIFNFIQPRQPCVYEPHTLHRGIVMLEQFRVSSFQWKETVMLTVCTHASYPMAYKCVTTMANAHIYMGMMVRCPQIVWIYNVPF